MTTNLLQHMGVISCPPAHSSLLHIFHLEDVILSTLLMSVECSHVGRCRTDLDHCDHEVVNDHDEGGKISKGGNAFDKIVVLRPHVFVDCFRNTLFDSSLSDHIRVPPSFVPHSLSVLVRCGTPFVIFFPFEKVGIDPSRSTGQYHPLIVRRCQSPMFSEQS
jgi:hypothetical protein